MERTVATADVRTALAALLGGLALTPVAGAAVPAGFSDERVAQIPVPTALAWTPDGRMLVTSQRGALRIVQNDVLLPAPALDLTSSVCSNGERGLLGVAVDPAFASNGFVYLYYTQSRSGSCFNRVSRFVLGVSNTIDPASERMLVENSSPAPNHEGGDVRFGKDGYLYVTIGDGGQSGAPARDRSSLFGKILRITRDGGVPPDNPFGTVVYAYGLRNPWRIALDPNSAATRFFVNDVGQNTWEEIDVLQPGADYGWNIREGLCAANSTTNCGNTPPGMTDPIYVYSHGDDRCLSITGGAFVPNGLWPGFDGAYLFADVVCGRIWRLDQSGGTYVSALFASGLGTQSVVHLEFGPWRGSQALYYTTYVGGGEVHRIFSTAAPPPPPPPPPSPPPPSPPPQPPAPAPRCVVPSLRGLTLRVARTRIARANCRLGRVTTARSSAVAAGRVLRQSPRAGTRLAAGARVSLVLARRG